MAQVTAIFTRESEQMPAYQGKIVTFMINTKSDWLYINIGNFGIYLAKSRKQETHNPR